MNNIKLNCLFCEKTRLEGRIDYPSLLRTALFLKYNPVDDQPIEDIIKHSHKKWVIDFYEKAQEMVDEEFLKKLYNNQETKNKLVDLTEYYKYRLDTPRLFIRPLSKVLDNYNKQRKEYHYTAIKYRLGILAPTVPIKTDVPYSQLLQITISQQDVSDSLISLLHTLSAPSLKFSKVGKVYTQSSSITTTKLYTQPKPLIKQSEQVSRKLKAILNNDIKTKQLSQYTTKIVQSKSHSNVKFNTMHSNNIYATHKKLSMQQNTLTLQPRTMMKTGSQADIISSIYLQKSNQRKQKKLMQIFYK